MARRLPAGARLVIASHNPGKLREILLLLAPHGVACVPATDLGLPEPEETAADFAGNARLKALAAAGRRAGGAGRRLRVLLAALGGAPGVVSARWAGPEKDFAAAMARVNREIGTTRTGGHGSPRALPGLAGRRDGHLHRPGGRHRRLAAARRAAVSATTRCSCRWAEAKPTGKWNRREKHATSHRARAFAQLLAAST